MTRLVSLSKDDMLIVFDLPRYSRESLLIMNHARSLGVFTILVTDSKACPLGQIAHLTSTVGSAGLGFTSSVIGMMFFASGVSARTPLCRDRESLPALRAIESLERQIGHYINPLGGESEQRG